MAKTNRPRKRMDRYFKNVQRNSYFLGYNKRGSCTTKIKKWDVIRRLTKKLVAEDEKAGKVPKKESRTPDPGVQLLPRQDVMLYGTIPKMEQRVYSKCKECSRVFNPRDVLSHRNCSKSSHSTHPSLLKKKVKSKSGSNKKTSSNSSLNSNSNSNSNSMVVSSSKDPIKDFVFKKPYTPPPLKTTSASMPQLKVSVTKIGLPKGSKSVTTVSASTTASTLTTSSDKSESRVPSSKSTTSVHHSPSRSSSVHHSSKSSSSTHSPKSPSSVHHNLKSPSSSLHHSPRSPSSSAHHSPRSPSSSSHSPRSPSSVHHSPRSPSKSISSHHGSSHHSNNSSSHHSSKSSSSSKPTPMDTLPPTSSSSHHHSSSSSNSSHSSSSHSSRHKKSSSSSSSKRSSSSSSTSSSSGSSSSVSSKTLPKDYDPDTHCGVIEGSRGPCMRSITCSNHRIQLRKLVPGRSKDIHQLIAERKAAKEKDLKHTTPPCSYTSPNGEAKDILSQNTTFVPIVGKIVSTTIESSVTSSFVPIMPRMSSHPTRPTSTSVLAKKINVAENEKDSSKALTNGYIRAKSFDSSQDGVIGTVPVLIMPMSPVSVVSSVQFLKIGNNIISLESPQSAMSPPLKKSSVILPIQTSNCNNIKMYKSHPKPIVLPSFGSRRVGGAILLANPRLESQRNELLTALSTKRESVNNNRGISLLNHSNSPHRPNILKVKGGTKTNCKRPASDKLVTSDSKRLVPDVNGFILHADVSETADAPQSNNCIQEKIALLNMK